MSRIRRSGWKRLLPAFVSTLSIGCSDTAPNVAEIVYRNSLGSLDNVEVITLHLVANEPYLISVEQNGLDIRLEAATTSGELLASSDIQGLVRGTESFVLVVPDGGEYDVTVTPVNTATTGSVELFAKKLPQVSAADNRWLEAEQAIAAAAAVTQSWDPAYWAPKIEDLSVARKSLCTMNLDRRCDWASTLEAWLRYKYLEQCSRSRDLARETLQSISRNDRPADYAAVMAIYAMAMIEADAHEAASDVAQRRKIAHEYFDEALKVQHRRCRPDVVKPLH